jgi:hypothetical protein
MHLICISPGKPTTIISNIQEAAKKFSGITIPTFREAATAMGLNLLPKPTLTEGADYIMAVGEHAIPAVVESNKLVLLQPFVPDNADIADIYEIDWNHTRKCPPHLDPHLENRAAKSVIWSQKRKCCEKDLKLMNKEEPICADVRDAAAIGPVYTFRLRCYDCNTTYRPGNKTTPDGLVSTMTKTQFEGDRDTVTLMTNYTGFTKKYGEGLYHRVFRQGTVLSDILEFLKVQNPLGLYA